MDDEFYDFTYRRTPNCEQLASLGEQIDFESIPLLHDVPQPFCSSNKCSTSVPQQQVLQFLSSSSTSDSESMASSSMSVDMKDDKVKQELKTKGGAQRRRQSRMQKKKNKTTDTTTGSSVEATATTPHLMSWKSVLT